jgi:hypothetical protein
LADFPLLLRRGRGVVVNFPVHIDGNHQRALRRFAWLAANNPAYSATRPACRTRRAVWPPVQDALNIHPTSTALRQRQAASLALTLGFGFSSIIGSLLSGGAFRISVNTIVSRLCHCVKRQFVRIGHEFLI